MQDQIAWTQIASAASPAPPDNEQRFANPRNLTPHPLGSQMPPPAPEILEAMRKSIGEHGVLAPVLITPDNVLIDGHTRCRLAIEEGREVVPIRVMRDLSDEAMLDIVAFGNLHRREMTPLQRAAWATYPDLYAAIIQKHKADGRARMSAGARSRHKATADGPGREPTGKARAPQTRDILGQRAGVSGRLIDHAITGWRLHPDKMRALLAGDLTNTVEQITDQGDAQKNKKRREDPPREAPSVTADEIEPAAAASNGAYDLGSVAPDEIAPTAPVAQHPLSTVPVNEVVPTAPVAQRDDVPSDSCESRNGRLQTDEEVRAAAPSARGLPGASPTDHGAARPPAGEHQVGSTAKRPRREANAQRRMQQHEERLVEAILGFLDEGWQPLNIYFLARRAVRRALEVRTEQQALNKRETIVDLIEVVAAREGSA